jgi:uncharacterized protein YjbI with pentapeptide repeats
MNAKGRKLNLSHTNLTGFDLSGLDLSGYRLVGAFLGRRISGGLVSVEPT